MLCLFAVTANVIAAPQYEEEIIEEAFVAGVETAAIDIVERNEGYGGNNFGYNNNYGGYGNGGEYY